MRARLRAKACATAVLVTVLAASSAIAAWAQAAPPSAARTEANRRDTIRYGIDAEIGDLIKDLTTEKDGRYNEDLLALFQNSHSPRLKTAILDFFSSLEWKGAERVALGLVDDRDNQDVDLVGSALSYAASIRSKEALRLSEAIIKEDNKKLLPALVKLMGRAGGAAEEDILLGWFDGDSATPALKEEAIKALGEIGSAKAAERLGKLVQDATAGKAARMYACEALAKIKEGASVGPLVKAANDADPNVRTSAIEALGFFAGDGSGASAEAARGAIAEGLRDSYPKARIAACKAAAAGKVASALPFLRYKAQNDPEKAVKSEACRSLAALGGDSFVFLRERLEDTKEDTALRTLCFGLLARYDPAGSGPVLEARLKAEAAEKERTFYTDLAREVANADKAPGIGSLARILLSDKEYLIRVAGIEWARKNKSQDLKPDLERLSRDDPSDLIKKRAAEALKAY
ncbi:MAG: HEAT repeat domain-containing protein [Rectinemataceae bacterium]